MTDSQPEQTDYESVPLDTLLNLRKTQQQILREIEDQIKERAIAESGVRVGQTVWRHNTPKEVTAVAAVLDLDDTPLISVEARRPESSTRIWWALTELELEDPNA